MTKNRDTLWLNAWYGKRKWNYCLLPLMWLFQAISGLRRILLTRFFQQQLALPVIVVGNISVGGTGKTPLLIALVKHLQTRGWKPGVISRGYGGNAPHYPFLLSASATVAEAGDEPLSIFQLTGCPVSVGADRVASGQLLQQQGCNILLSDDGLQHYRLGRALEIAVIDGQRGFGNNFCLPVGPLRESSKRLREVDLVVVNGTSETRLPELNETHPMTIQPRYWARVKSDEQLPLNYLPPATVVHAVAGIGNPERFYQSLRALQLEPRQHDFPDHHVYDALELNFSDQLPVVMTTKDAVKCRSFARDNWYALVIEAHLPTLFWQRFDALLAPLDRSTSIN